MPAQLKHAWFDLIVGAAMVFTYLVLLPFVGAEHAFTAIAIMAAGAFAPLFYRKRRGSAAPVTDERDQQIHLRSLAVSWAALWLFFVAFCMITWQTHRGGTIRADLLPNMLAVGYVVVTLSRASATVVLYGRQGG
jgi:hypothetical protein